MCITTRNSPGHALSRLPLPLFFLTVVACGGGGGGSSQTTPAPPNPTPTGSNNVQINEVVASNSIHDDEDGDSPDWLELVNNDVVDLSLTGWTLTDDAGDPGKWTFPAFTLQRNEFVHIWASDKDRTELGIYRTLINRGAVFRYLVPTSSVAADWTALDFDDASWQQGATGFGYGDGDDATDIPAGTLSVFVRRKFTIANVNAIESLLLDIDYDDAFVAYINGIEIARSDLSGSPPLFDDTPLIDHEALIYRNAKPERFAVTDPQAVLQSGDNVLSIQVHNISINSSDLTLIPFLSAFYTTATTDGGATPAVLELVDHDFHTNFKISSAGETVYLYDAAGALVDSLLVENARVGISVGISVNDGSVVYYDTPTPGLANSQLDYSGVTTSEVEFSHTGGVVGALSLSLSGAAGLESIRYTLDASVPDDNSPLYGGALAINESTVVRARVFTPNYIPSRTSSHTYLINIAHDLPIVSLVTDGDNLFDEQTGIYAFGSTYDPQFPYFGANFWQDWEREVNFSLYETDGTLGVSFDGGIKIFGGWLRAFPQRSFSIFARGRYGFKEIDYPLFPQLTYDKFQALVLRNSGNDWLRTMMKDAFLTSLMDGSGLETQAVRPVAVYVNKDYWGMYNLREKVNEHFLASKHNLNADDIDLLEFAGQAIEGDNQEYVDLLDYINTNDLASTVNYDYVAARVDIENYITYLVAQIYFDNKDWPGNNIKFWNSPTTKWRWILFDTDFGFGGLNPDDYLYDTLSFALADDGPAWPNPPWSTFLFRSLVVNNTFRNQLINHFADEMNTRFLPGAVSNLVDNMSATITAEMLLHFERWEGGPNWAADVQTLKVFGNQRPAHMKDHIRNQFNLAALHTLTIENDDVTIGHVQLNSLTISDAAWSGDYFEGVPVNLTAIPAAGYQFSVWSGASSATTAEIELDLTSGASIKPVFIAIP